MDFHLDLQADASKRTPGVVEAWYAVKNELSTIATPSPSAATPMERIYINDDHVFSDETNGWRKMYLSTKTKAVIKSFGDEDAKGAETTLEAFIPGINAKIAGFLFEDPELIVLIPNGPCGTSEYIQIGDKCRGAKITEWEANTQELGANSAKGVSLKISRKGSFLTLYAGALPEPSA
jgi:hypothetical protein